MQHHIVGIAFGADMDPVDMQIKRRRGQLLGIVRNLFVLLDVARVEQILDGQGRERISEMDNQPLARVDLERRRWIESVAFELAVRRGAMNELVREDEEVLDRFGDRVERDLSLMRSELDFEEAPPGWPAPRVRGRGFLPIDRMPWRLVPKSPRPVR
jgi:hypothetical protein